MFLFTVTKPGLRQAGALALCAVCLCGTVAAAVHFSGDAVAAAAPVTATVETTQDIGTYFTGYGFETDLSSAAVDEREDPRKVGRQLYRFQPGGAGKRSGPGQLQRQNGGKSGRCFARSFPPATRIPTAFCWCTKPNR